MELRRELQTFPWKNQLPDQIFADPRLAAIYDAFDGQRKDLDHYLAIAKELDAKSVLDIGCGTGSFACKLIESGIEVTGLDPARASLDIARRKPNANQVRWILGDATNLPSMSVDLAVMTGNVTQVFLTDQSLEETFIGIRKALHPNGHLVFEVRNPAQKAWLDWNREKTYERRHIAGIGNIEGWCEVIDVSEELVSFRWTYTFESDGQVITSDSTLRFRERKAVEESLKRTGYIVNEVREAPDRPNKEFVFIAALA